MSKFDPYRTWLGIPPQEQPPNCYRLLGIGLFESEPEVIANAADRQMVHVRSYQRGKYSKLSQRIMNELAAARLCLLDPARKAGYDEQLRRDLAARYAAPVPLPVMPPPPMPVVPPPLPPGFAGPVEPAVAVLTEPGPRPRPSAAAVQAMIRRRQRKKASWIAAMVTVISIGALLVGLAVLVMQVKRP